MAIITVNPYKASDPVFTDGLDYIAANIPGSPTLDDLTETIMEYFLSLPEPEDEKLVDAMAFSIPNSVNDYVNWRIMANQNFNATEFALVRAVFYGIKNESIESMGNFLDACTEQVALCKVNTVAKTSIYQAIGLANANQAYWKNIVTTPGAWSTYINSNAAINYANIPHWTTASVLGSFSGFAQIQYPNISGATVFNGQGRSAGGVIAVGSALALTAGKVIFKWAQRPRIVCPPKNLLQR